MSFAHDVHALGAAFADQDEQIDLYLSAPFDANFKPLPEQPSDEKKAELLRDAEGAHRMAEFRRAVANTVDGQVDDPEQH